MVKKVERVVKRIKLRFLDVRLLVRVVLLRGRVPDWRSSVHDTGRDGGRGRVRE